ncbi:uncharacterized protein LTR77_007767 [Saxophila tyrrhenica]|uniref:Uncharacterized protein n=1 Tax=Saxophila tyrrhenica TaxID=1690608 RepID=A0AAV9P712_9PEZI|nr:hypothetical protein LTR77_007767 [Saxophila tyrrhenica]
MAFLSSSQRFVGHSSEVTISHGKLLSISLPSHNEATLLHLSIELLMDLASRERTFDMADDTTTGS